MTVRLRESVVGFSPAADLLQVTALAVAVAALTSVVALTTAADIGVSVSRWASENFVFLGLLSIVYSFSEGYLWKI